MPIRMPIAAVIQIDAAHRGRHHCSDRGVEARGDDRGRDSSRGVEGDGAHRRPEIDLRVARGGVRRDLGLIGRYIREKCPRVFKSPGKRLPINDNRVPQSRCAPIYILSQEKLGL